MFVWNKILFLQKKGYNILINAFVNKQSFANVKKTE